VGGRTPSSSLGEEAAQQGDGQLKSRRLIYTERRLTARLTTVVGRSRSEQTSPTALRASVRRVLVWISCGGRAPDLAPYTAE